MTLFVTRRGSSSYSTLILQPMQVSSARQVRLLVGEVETTTGW